jgi:hypothetical protein
MVRSCLRSSGASVAGKIQRGLGTGGAFCTGKTRKSKGRPARSRLALEFKRPLSKTVSVDAATFVISLLLIAAAVSHLIAKFELLWMRLLELCCLKILELRRFFGSARLSF